MQITPTGANTNFAPITQPVSQKVEEGSSIFSADQMKISEIKVNPAFQKQFDMYIELQRAAGKGNLNGLSDSSANLSNVLEHLTNAYDKVKSGLNENSENSQKHSKFLDDAFEMMTKSIFDRNADRLSINVTGSNPGSLLVNGENPFVESGRKQAQIFSDAFLKDYKKNGTDALVSAMDKLRNMPQTTSLFNINFNDFKVLNDKMEKGFILSDNNTVTDLIKGNDLSDFMKDVLSKSYSNYKGNYSGSGLMQLPPEQSIRLDMFV